MVITIAQLKPTCRCFTLSVFACIRHPLFQINLYVITLSALDVLKMCYFFFIALTSTVCASICHISNLLLEKQDVLFWIFLVLVYMTFVVHMYMCA